MSPVRHQRKREAGYRIPAGVVCVSRPSLFGNPFFTAKAFREWMASGHINWGELITPWPGATEQKTREVLEERWGTIRSSIHTLRGKDLACWCGPDKDCHADVLIEMANQLEAT